MRDDGLRRDAVLRQQRRQAARPRELRGEVRPVAQPGQGGRRLGGEVKERAAHPVPPGPGLGQDVLGPDQGRAGEPAETLVERDVHRVRDPGDLGERAVVGGLRLPHPGAVEVEGGTPLPRRRRELDEVLPLREQAAGVAQRQLDQHGRQLPGDRREVVDRRGPGTGGQVLEAEAVEQPGAVGLVEQEVGQVGEGDPGGADPVAPHAQRALLGHGAAGEEGRGPGAEHLGELGLHQLHRSPGAVAVPPEVVRRRVLGRLGERGGRGPGQLPEGGSRAGLGDRAELGELDHQLSTRIDSGSPPPSWTSSTSSASAVSATRCELGP